MNLNSVQLAGNLTRDPEVRYTPKGLAIAKFGLAINRKWKDQVGELKEEVTFVDVDSFGKLAEVIAQYFKKGSRIFITGRLKTDQWEDKQTRQRRTKLCVVAETFQFVDRADGKSSAPQTSRPTAAAPTRHPAPDESSEAPGAAQPDLPASDAPAGDDDVPF